MERVKELKDNVNENQHFGTPKYHIISMHIGVVVKFGTEDVIQIAPSNSG